MTVWISFVVLVALANSFVTAGPIIQASKPLMVQIDSEEQLKALMEAQAHQQPLQEDQQQSPQAQNVSSSKAVVDKLVSKINDSIQSRRATISLCKRVHGIFFRGRCIIAENNIEMVIGTVFADRKPMVENKMPAVIGFGNPSGKA